MVSRVAHINVVVFVRTDVTKTAVAANAAPIAANRSDQIEMAVEDFDPG